MFSRKSCTLLVASALLFTSCKKDDTNFSTTNTGALTATDASKNYVGSSTIAAGETIKKVTGLVFSTNDYICATGSNAGAIVFSPNKWSSYPSSNLVTKIDILCKEDPYHNPILVSPAKYGTSFLPEDINKAKNIIFYEVNESAIDFNLLKSNGALALNHIKFLKDKSIQTTQQAGTDYKPKYFVYVIDFTKTSSLHKFGLIKTQMINGSMVIDMWAQVF